MSPAAMTSPENSISGIQGRVRGVDGIRFMSISVLKVRETWDMRIRTSGDEGGGGVGVGCVVDSWRFVAGPRWGRTQARIVGGIVDVMM